MTQGSVLFFIYKESCDNSTHTEIAKLCKGYDNFSIYHTALYLGDQKICESTAEEGVKIRTLRQDDIPFLSAEIFDRDLARKSSEVVIKWVGKPYNPSFKKNSKGFYCSELVCEAYKHANKSKKVFGEQELIFEKNSAYWKKYYQNLNQKIPYGEYGTHPARLSCDPAFQKMTLHNYFLF